MKVTDLKENECINCETEEQAKAICKLMHEAGLKWRDGNSYLEENGYYIYKSGTCYFATEGVSRSLYYIKEKNYKIYKAEQFLNLKQEVMSTVVNINPDTSEINITPKEGFEIDLENSDLKNGKVLLKEVKEKYPSEFKYNVKRHGLFNLVKLSATYYEKLEILDTLLCLRDEYNRIDGFSDGFRFGEENWAISNWKNNLDVDIFGNANKPMHFIKEETAKLFLKNFEKQLEQIKEFL